MSTWYHVLEGKFPVRVFSLWLDAALFESSFKAGWVPPMQFIYNITSNIYVKQVWVSINLFSQLSPCSICLFVPVWLAAGLRQWVLNNMEGCAVSRRMLCSQQKLGSGWSCCRYTHTRSLAHARTWAACQTPLKACIERPRVAQHTGLTHTHPHTLTHTHTHCCTLLS